MSFYIKLFAIFFLTILNSQADEIHLRNDDHFSGQLISLSPTTCIFKTQYQATLNIPSKQLLSLNVTSPVAVELYSGEKLIGSLVTDNNKFILHSKRFGSFPIQIKDIKSINRLNTNNSAKIKPQNSEIQSNIELAKLHARASPDKLANEDENKFRISLPQSDVLLVKKGEQEFGLSMSYAYDQFDGQRTRDFSFPLTWSIGLTDKLGFFIDLPITWVFQDNYIEDKFNKNKNFGIGDIHFGFNYLLLSEKNILPDLVGSIGVTIPTGDDNFANSNKVSLGNGHWKISTNLLAMKTYDPAILFGNIGYTHIFTNTFDGVEISPGNIFTYALGAGFVLNNRLAFFSQIEGSYQTETESNSMKNQGSDNDQMLVRDYFSYSLSKNSYVQPSITFGVNEDAPDFILDFAYFYRF